MTAPLTFLFTDLEDSTRLWDQFPEAMQLALARHNDLLQQAVDSHHGRVVKHTGDGIYAVFDAAANALQASLSAQLALSSENWPDLTGRLKVRMGLHTGESQEQDGDYFGAEVSRAARILDLAYGGQVLLSEASAVLLRDHLPAEVTLSDLGRHRLKGLATPERIFQLCHPSLQADFPPLKSLSTLRHNLEHQPTSFVGRKEELEEVERLLGETQLLTLLGPGGTGKTRLMLQAAEEVIEEYDDGVWLVELAQLTDPDLIPERVAATLSVQEQPGQSILTTLTRTLRRKKLLLLLDNVEHLVREAAVFAQHILGQCRLVKILVTGREALFIGGETTLQIPSLSLPGSDGAMRFEEVRTSEAVQLFVERARAVRPDFQLTPQNASTVAELVRRLDGIPLALELAAARIRMLTVEQIAARLSDRFRLLTGGRRTAIPRQQTLQALIDWSWNLLGKKERILLRRLSVFSGGWSLDAAQAVVQDDELDEFEVFDYLEQLINKSLVTVSYPGEGEARYDMLESIHQYAADRLLEAAEGQSLRDRHAEAYMAFAEEAYVHQLAPDMLDWVERIVIELDNVRSVLEWTQEDRPELALRIGGALLYFEAHWLHPREARSWLEPAIERGRELFGREDGPIRAEDLIRAVIALGVANASQGRAEAALESYKAGLQMAREAGELGHVVYGTVMRTGQVLLVRDLSAEDMRDLDEAVSIGRQLGSVFHSSFALLMRALVLARQGKLNEAIPALEEEMERVEAIDSPRVTIGLLPFRASLAAMKGDFEEAKSLYLLALDRYGALNSHRQALSTKSELGHLSRRLGNRAEATDYYRQTITAWLELGHVSAVAHQLECLAFVAIDAGAYEHAAMLLGAARRTRAKHNATTGDPQEIAELNQAMEQLAEAMGEDERNRAMVEGSRLSLDDAVTLALEADG